MPVGDLALPPVRICLRQADVGKNAARELMRHLVERCRAEVVGGNERKDSRSGVGGAVHVVDVNFVERSFADAEHQRALLFEANVGGTLDQARSDAVGYTCERTDAAGITEVRRRAHDALRRDPAAMEFFSGSNHRGELVVSDFGTKLIKEPFRRAGQPVGSVVTMRSYSGLDTSLSGDAGGYSAPILFWETVTAST